MPLSQASLPYGKIRRSARGGYGYAVLIVLCACVFVVSACFLADYIIASVRNGNVQRGIAQQYHIAADGGAGMGADGAAADGGVGMGADGAASDGGAGMGTDGAASDGGAGMGADGAASDGGAGMSADGAAANGVSGAPGRYTIGAHISPEMKTLRLINRDIVAWLTIEDVVDQPVLYKDNSYYLTHDVNKDKSYAGALFLDVNAPLAATTQHLVIHGHNMRDGSMLGKLTRYHDIEFFRSHCLFSLDTLYESARYVVFAVIDVDLDVASPDFYNFMGYPAFTGESAFAAFLAEVDGKSRYTRQIDVALSDVLLTMATCIGEDRLVVIARRVRAGESEQALRLSMITSMVRR